MCYNMPLGASLASITFPDNVKRHRPTPRGNGHHSPSLWSCTDIIKDYFTKQRPVFILHRRHNMLPRPAHCFSSAPQTPPITMLDSCFSTWAAHRGQNLPDGYSTPLREMISIIARSGSTDATFVAANAAATLSPFCVKCATHGSRPLSR